VNDPFDRLAVLVNGMLDEIETLVGNLSHVGVADLLNLGLIQGVGAHADTEQRRRRSTAARWSRPGRRSVIQYSSYQRGFTGKGDIGCLQ
jgi:hypothetical protein